MRVTAKDVAAASDVSLASVSRAFRANAPIAPALRQKILLQAKQLGYVPPLNRERGDSGRRAIALIAGDIENPFYAAALRSFAEQGATQNIDINVYLPPQGGSVDDIMRQVLESGVDAVVITSALLSSTLAIECQTRGLPVVLFNRVQTDPGISAVSADNYGGGTMVAKRFLAQGHRHLAFVGGLARASTHLERRRGFLDAATAGAVHEVAGDYDYAQTYMAVSQLLEDVPCVTALFCANDLMAFAAIDSARAKGMVPGQDISIIGYDDVPMAQWESYQLTTVSQQTEKLVRETLSLVVASDLLADPEIRIIPGALIERQSG